MTDIDDIQRHSAYNTPYQSYQAYPPPPAEPPEAAGRRRARGPVAVMAAVAIVAAAVGGSSSALLAEALSSDGSSTAVAGNNVSVGSGTDNSVTGVAQAVSPSVVEIASETPMGTSTGSGVILSENGEIVT